MNFFPFHIGDYAAHTKHLSLLEDLAYRRLLDLYYTNERALPTDPAKVARLIGMREHLQEVSDVLSDFFLISEEGHTNKRCDREISKYQEKAERAVKANKSRWKSDPPLKSDKTSDLILDVISDQRSDAFHVPTNNQEPRTINQEPITNNHEPIKDKQKKETTKTKNQTAKPSDVSDAVWSDFLQVRKARKLPLTETALRLLRTGAEKGGYGFQEALEICCARGWASFDPNWLKTPSKPVHSELATETVYQRSMRLRYEEASGLRSANDRNVIDITPMQTHAARIA